jgi:hypothetical protein
MLCLPYNSYVFSSTKSVVRAELDLPGTEEGGQSVEEGDRVEI